MSGTHTMTVGNKGRVVLPADLRQSRNWSEGTTLVAVERDEGVMLMTREELERLIRAQLADKDPVGELLAERRAASLAEDNG